MKTLLASCAAVALMAAPALAQSTNDPMTPQQVPVDPAAEQTQDPIVEFEPQTDVVPQDELAMEDDATTEDETSDLAMDDDMSDEDGTAGFAMDEGQAEDDWSVAETDAPIEADLTEGVDILQASVDEAELPEEYSTDDLNARMMAEMDEVSVEIAGLNIDAGTTGYSSAPTSVSGVVAEGDADYPVESEAPETDEWTTPEAETPMGDDPWASPDDEMTDY